METWTVARMAEYCHPSTDYFAYSFKKNMGMAPMRYLEELRIAKASWRRPEITYPIFIIRSNA